jgi:thymidylate synthase/dihydrofolate reductase
LREITNYNLQFTNYKLQFTIYITLYKTMRKFNIIAAVTPDGVIGVNDVCPHTGDELKKDRAWFYKTTRDCSVIMGRRTYDTLDKPLKNRLNIVLTRADSRDKLVDGRDVAFRNTFEECLTLASTYGQTIWVIGGAEIYALAMEHPLLDAIYITTVADTVSNVVSNTASIDVSNTASIDVSSTASIDVSSTASSDVSTKYTYFPKYHSLCNGITPVGFPSELTIYKRLPGECGYTALLKRLLDAPIRENRTGVPTRCLFAESLRFNLYSHGLVMPLVTTKKVPYRVIVAELLWFLSGKCTDISYLHKHNVHIWDANTTPEFLQSRGLDYEAGSTGPIYGYQWRNFNGVDQIANVIEKLKTDPYDRRMIVSAWNPPELCKMALPPCHWSFQFYVSEGSLSCCMNMRSADMALGVPFNIASYATLTHIVARIVGLQPGELVVNMADCHLYTDHVEGVREQLKNTPYEFPKLEFPDIKSLDDCERLEPTDFKLRGYKHHGAIKYKMAV